MQDLRERVFVLYVANSPKVAMSTHKHTQLERERERERDGMLSVL
jgi:hypothetical protein